jgi:hypothetical protein
MDGVNLSTTYLSSSQVKGYVPSSSATPGVHTIRVYHGGSCGTSSPISLKIPSPSVPCPTISGTSFSPSSPVSDQEFTIYISGQNLNPDVRVQMDGVNLSTTYLSSSQVKGYVPSSSATSGVHTIRVYLGGSCGTSSSVSLTIPTTPEIPTISYIRPSRIKAGSSSFTLYIYGTNFASTSKILWNKKTIPSKMFYSSTKLTAIVNRSWVKNRGSALIEVYTKNAGYSNAVTFRIT